MQRMYALVAIALLITGCTPDDALRSDNGPTLAQIMHRPDKILQLNLEKGTAEIVDISSLPPEAQQLHRQLRDSTKPLPPNMQRLLELHQRGFPLAFAEPGMLPAGAVAQIIRSPSERVVVMDASTAHDWGITLAQRALIADELTVTDVTERRVITIQANGEGIDAQGNIVEGIRPLPDTDGRSRQRMVVRRLLNRAESQAPTELPGVGTIRRVPL
jgi:hypothetical protein